MIALAGVLFFGTTDTTSNFRLAFSITLPVLFFLNTFWYKISYGRVNSMIWQPHIVIILASKISMRFNKKYLDLILIHDVY
jgi:hypothetical protein